MNAPGAAPTFPPLLTGIAVTGRVEPFDRARALAALGCDAGTVVHNVTADRLAAALVLAPEVPLSRAMAMLPACGLGFQNALGALGPPEVAVHLDWAGGLRRNPGIPEPVVCTGGTPARRLVASATIAKTNATAADTAALIFAEHR